MLNEFIDYLEEQVKNGSIYVLGAQGQTGSQITESWIKKREHNVKKNYTRAIEFWNKQIAKGFAKLRAYDCSGLGMYWLQNLKGIFDRDMTAHDMSKQCDKISKSQLRKGDWVLKKNTVGRVKHIGYVVDNALNVIEAQGRAYGVVKRPLSAYNWNQFGRPRIFKSEIEIDGVRVIGKAVNVRDADSVAGNVLGVVYKGDILPYKGVAPSGWYQVGYGGEDAYISNRADLTASPQTWTLNRLLKKKLVLMRGEDVKAVQDALTKAGYSVGRHGADGKFGNDTKSAVIAYQRAHKLKVDGIVGQQTVAALGGVWAR